MSPEMFSIGLRLTGIALIGVAILSFVNGTAPATGSTVREALRPSLRSIRDGSELSRAQLADRSLLVAIVVAGVAVVVEQSFLAVVIAALLWTSRPAVARLATEERPLFAVAGQFSADLLIGLYTPMVLAQIALGNSLIATSFAFVLLALCWPPGGAGGVRDTWRPAWVNN